MSPTVPIPEARFAAPRPRWNAGLCEWRNAGLRLAILVALIGTVVPESHAQYYIFGRNKVQYVDFDWHVLRTEHFDIYYYPEMRELAEHGAFFAEEIFDELQNRFAFDLSDRVPLIFYATNLHFKQTNTTPGFIPDGVGGFFEFLKGRVVIPANGDLHRFRRVIRHELVHVFTFNRIVRVLRDYRKPIDRFVPLWFTEGLAEYWSGEPDYNHEMVIRDALYSNYIVPLESIYRIEGSFLMYKQGEALCRYISETYGEHAILELIDNIWIDRDFRKVMEHVLREDFDVISANWMEWLKEQYYPDLRNGEFPSMLSTQVSGKGFSSKPDVYIDSKGQRHVFYVGNEGTYSGVYEVEVDSAYQPISRPREIIEGERSDRYEAFHLFESRLSVSDSGTLAFVTKSGARDVIHLYDVEARKLITTLDFVDLTAVYSPAWSPDGTKLAFSSIDKSGFSDLYLFDTDQGKLDRLTQDYYDDRDPSWSPDGAYLAFSSDRTSSSDGASYNLFSYELDSGRIDYITTGERFDLSPRWSPDGSRLVFASTTRDSTGRFGPQDLWVAELGSRSAAPPSTASLNPGSDTLAFRPTVVSRLTSLSGGAFDPSWTRDDHIVFSSFEGYRFSVRSMGSVDSLLRKPKQIARIGLEVKQKKWSFGKLGIDDGAEDLPYRKRYRLDIAQGQISQSASVGTFGGAVLAFSDMLSNDYLYLTIFNTAESQRGFLRDLSASVTRVQLHKRANIAYGAFRFAGRRYDITDPDALASLPIFYETQYGGFGGISYPISKFRRVEVSSSLSWSDKEVVGKERKALLLSNSVSVIHDTALYSYNGPVDGWRGGVTAAYTTDLRYSNVSYFTTMADLRYYKRLLPGVTFATRVSGRWNQGREARLFVAGGSWDIRGFRLFEIRGQKMWLSTTELRFPILNAPTLIMPILAPFGIASLRGAVFFDAVHAWNDNYNGSATELREIFAGQTLGSTGGGLRLNLFNAIILRYDVGYRYTNGFKTQDRFFKQFFFGVDF
ncbi:MAG: PD40 domain-containing protein [Bacteroidetes bacterium]|nr:PD40 domain-containing protein [Bacteroidota bacterium]